MTEIEIGRGCQEALSTNGAIVLVAITIAVVIVKCYRMYLEHKGMKPDVD